MIDTPIVRSTGGSIARRSSTPVDIADRVRAYDRQRSVASGRARSSSLFPGQWVREGGLRSFRDGTAYTGRSVAGLKMLLSIAVVATEDPAVIGFCGTSALLSYEQLCWLAGLSKPLLAAGKKLLCAQGLVRIAHEGPRHRVRYFLNHEDGAARIAHGPVSRSSSEAEIKDLHRFTCRKTEDLNALKLYVLLCALGNARFEVAALSFAEIARQTNISEVKAVDAVAMLTEYGLVTADRIDLRLNQGRTAYTFQVCPLK